jgi:hypothetical protein
MRLRKWSEWAIVLLLTFTSSGLALAGPVDQVTVDIGVLIASSVTLTLTPNAITFPDANPDTTPSIPATQNPVAVQCRVVGSGSWNLILDAQATGNLISGSNSIPINQVRWTATGAGYTAGTMSTTPVRAGQWTSSGNRTYNGTFSYFLQNNWTYATGNYVATVTYTLHSP